MKRILISIIIIFSFCTYINAQKDPGNHLRKTISELRQVFPDVSYRAHEDSKDYYLASENKIMFTVYNGKVVSEFTHYRVKDGFENMLLKNWFASLVEKYSKTTRVIIWKDDHNVIFKYPYYSIQMVYVPYEGVRLNYALDKAYWN